MNRQTILIVEDEPLLLEILVSEFQDAGYHVLAAENAGTALASIENEAKIDLLFTDIRMPGKMDGWEIARRARAVRPQLPVIYATGYSAHSPAIVEGALLFIKPYRVSEILSAAQALAPAR